jgi:hypothetical protein
MCQVIEANGIREEHRHVEPFPAFYKGVRGEKQGS